MRVETSQEPPATVSMSENYSNITKSSVSPLKEISPEFSSSLLTMTSSEDLETMPTLAEHREEVDYRDNPTQLFVSIEECDWEGAQKQCLQDPTQARTWIVSTGTEKTLFSWSVWRRLPIHEACRRQPPLSLIQNLLSIYPEGAHSKSQFGELPLHLAAGCGASPEIVNLLLSYHPWGVMMRDNGGRTPIEIIRAGGKLREDSHVIEEALEQCEKAVNDRKLEMDDKICTLKTEHAGKVLTFKKQAEKAIADKVDTITNLKKRLERGKRQIDQLVETMKDCETRIMDKNDAETHLMDRVFHLERENGRIRTENQKLKNVLLSSEQIQEKKKDHIENLGKVIGGLLSDIEKSVEEKNNLLYMARKTEKDTAYVLEQQQSLNFHIEKQKEDIRNRAVAAAKATAEITGKSHFTFLGDMMDGEDNEAAYSPSDANERLLTSHPPVFLSDDGIDDMAFMTAAASRGIDSPVNSS